MSARQKLTLLITAVGLFAALFFSGVTLWKMVDDQFDLIDEELEALAKRTAESFGGSAELDWNDNTSALINDPQATAEAQKTALSLFGEAHVITSRPPDLGGDDFAEYIKRVPGAYAYVGSANPQNPDTQVAHHNSHFDIDEDALTVAVSLYACYAAEYLNRLA